VNYHSEATEGVIAITFMAFPRHMKSVAGVLCRLEQVRDLQVYDYNDPRLVKTATIRVSRTVTEIKAMAGDTPVSVVDLEKAAGGTYGAVISGLPKDVDTVIKRIKQSGVLISTIYAVLPPK
jgi:hypothetical protein